MRGDFYAAIDLRDGELRSATYVPAELIVRGVVHGRMDLGRRHAHIKQLATRRVIGTSKGDARMATAAEYTALADVSEARLLESIGEAALEGSEGESFRQAIESLSGRQTRGERARAAADAWLARSRETLHHAICGNEKIRKAFSSDPGATVEIAKTIGDVISTLHLVVPVPTLAMLVARKGLNWICPD
jgi:hypothetical protein